MLVRGQFMEGSVPFRGEGSTATWYEFIDISPGCGGQFRCMSDTPIVYPEVPFAAEMSLQPRRGKSGLYFVVKTFKLIVPSDNGAKDKTPK